MAAKDRALAEASRRSLQRYRNAVAKGQKVSRSLVTSARASLRHLGGDGEPSGWSLADYDHRRYGPYLGVSDEGSAAPVIRRAAHESPKARALGAGDPTVVGVALDAERLGGVGEVAVGPDEYVDAWIECVGRLLISTNVGTRANLRFYKHEPLVVIPRGSRDGVLPAAREELTKAFQPFLRTPNREPRPLTVLVSFQGKRPVKECVAILRRLVAHTKARGVAAPKVHGLGLYWPIPKGPKGAREAKRGVDLARAAGVHEVALAGAVRGHADEAISLPGLLNYLAPGLLGPLLRYAKARGVMLRPKNTVDPETVARSIWSTLNTARAMGLHLGKYGVFPLTLEESDAVVSEIQRWFPNWSAAPVFFVDQGLLSRERVDVGHDVASGLRTWLTSVAKRGVRVVLIDTVDKAAGYKLLRSGPRKRGDKALLGPRQIAELDAFAAKRGIKVLWAGGLDLSQVFELGKLGVFGVYVTSAASEGIAVPKSYERDPALAAVKEPTYDGVFRTKLLLEAGFLCTRVRDTALRKQIETQARALLRALGSKQKELRQLEADLVLSAMEGWRKR